MELAGLGMALTMLALCAQAAPIRPDLRKLLDQPQPVQQFAPARAGWDGPEMPARPQLAANSVNDIFNPAASAHALRGSMLALALPDLRFLTLVVLAILLLRRMRKVRQRSKAAATLGLQAGSRAETTTVSPTKSEAGEESPEELRPAA
jgi:hypothetical protein